MGDGDGYSNTGHVQIIKFSPATTGNYEYLSECGGRGNCDYDSGICDCYSGYTGLACEEVDGLAVDEATATTTPESVTVTPATPGWHAKKSMALLYNFSWITLLNHGPPSPEPHRVLRKV